MCLFCFCLPVFSIAYCCARLSCACVYLVKCNSSRNSYEYSTSIWFQSIIELKILSLHFSSCKLQYGYEINSKAEMSVNITKSVFENSAIDIRSTESNLNVTVSNCTFSSSNSLAALSMLTLDFHEGAYHISRITIANLQITDTLFQDNINTQHNLIVIYTNLMIDNCCFMNNSLAYGDGSIFVFSSLLTLKNTTFLHSVRRCAWKCPPP